MSESEYKRLSDKVLESLQMALEQKDIAISELLASALDLTMTRNTGGGEFVERRDYPKAAEEAMDALKALKS